MSKPIPIIWGTDWFTDCDDVVAARILAWAHQSGLIEIKAIHANTRMNKTVQSLDAFMQAEGLYNLPIGLDYEATNINEEHGLYQEWLATYPHRFENDEDYEEAISLLRRTLAEADEPMQIIEVGFCQNLSKLLLSRPDNISPLSGMDLLKQKVSKLWMMAGKWDEPNGKEYNITTYDKARQGASIICKKWPTPITFLGYEVGNTVITGDTLSNENDLLKGTLVHAKRYYGRLSWDPMLVYMACMQSEEKAGYELIKGYAEVNPETGENNFIKDINGPHGYVVKKQSDSYYSNTLNRILKEREKSTNKF